MCAGGPIEIHKPLLCHGLENMPNSSSARKSQRQNETHRLRNRSRRSSLRTSIKKFHAAVKAGADSEAIETSFRAAVKSLDQAAARKLIHKNNAARTKSRLSKLKSQP